MNMNWWGSFAKSITGDAYPNTPVRITFCLIAYAVLHEDALLEAAVNYVTSKYPMKFTQEETHLYELYKIICRLEDYPALRENQTTFLTSEEGHLTEVTKSILQSSSTAKQNKTQVVQLVEDACRGFQSLRDEVDAKSIFCHLMHTLKKLYLSLAGNVGVEVPDAPTDTFVCCEGCPCYARLRTLHTVFLRDIEKAKVIDCIMMTSVKENDVPLRDAASELLYNHFHDFMENPYLDDISYFIHNGKLFFCRAALFDALSLIAYFAQANDGARARKDDVNRIVIPLLWVKNEIRDIRGLNTLVGLIDKALLTAEGCYVDAARADFLQAFHTIKDYIISVFGELSSPKYHLAVHSRDVFTGKHVDMKCANPSCDGNTKELLKCSGCDVTYYCSSHCQKADWDIHKIFCHDIESRRAHPTPVAAHFSPVMRIMPVV